MVMRAGLLRHRLRIEEAVDVTSTSGDGQPTKAWNVLGTVWGSVEPLSGRELFTAQQVSARTTHKITIRARSISPKHRLVYGQRVFHLTSVANKSERDISVEVMAEEVTA
jgi:SPP1 family predicted phage head-tail adaptor